MTKEFPNKTFESDAQQDPDSLDSLENLLRLLADLSIIDRAKREKAAAEIQKTTLPNSENPNARLPNSKISRSIPQNSETSNAEHSKSNFSEQSNSGDSNGNGQDYRRDRLREVPNTNSSRLSKLGISDDLAPIQKAEQNLRTSAPSNTRNASGNGQDYQRDRLRESPSAASSRVSKLTANDFGRDDLQSSEPPPRKTSERRDSEQRDSEQRDLERRNLEQGDLEQRDTGHSNGNGQRDRRSEIPAAPMVAEQNSYRDRIKKILAMPVQSDSSFLEKLQNAKLDSDASPAIPSLLDDIKFLEIPSIQPEKIPADLTSPTEVPQKPVQIPQLETQSNISPESDLGTFRHLSKLLGDLNGLDSTKKPEDTSIPPEKPKAADETAQLQVLQNILVEPELVQVRNFLETVELKLTTLEHQVNDPALELKLKELETQMSDTSEIGDMQRKMAEMASQQTNLLTNFPTELANLRQRLMEVEQNLYEPEQLVNLLMPVIVELLNRKISESKEDISQAIVPIIDSVIHQRTQEDKVAMSNALAEIIPAAISQQIQNSPKEIAKAIGPEIGAAIQEQIRLDKDVIANALAPEMGAAIKQQILLERDAMVDALYPVIGNTISKYLSEAIRAINERVERTFSLEGMQRKMRAKMQGVSEAELILKESMPYEVQAVFLIQKDSGLVMVDLQKRSDDPEFPALESDMVAGMLTAIRTFVNDCIARSGNVSELDEIDYGGSKIVLEVAGYCYLAVVIQGEPDKKFILKIRNTLSELIQKHDKWIEQFDGDSSTIPSAVYKLLQPLLDKPDPEKSTKSNRGLLIVGFVVLGLILVPWGFYQYRNGVDRRLEAKTTNAIASTPELAVYRLNVAANGERLQLSGQLPNQYLRDRAAQVTQRVILAENPQLTIDNQIFAVDVPPDPVLAAAEVQRVTALLNQTAGTAIATSFKVDKITITGKVTEPAIADRITQALAQIPGVKYITNTVTIQPPELTTRIYFYTGLADLRPEDTVRILEVTAFLERYPSYNLKILGRSDPIGDPFSNQQLASDRGQSVYNALVQRGIDRKRLQVIGLDYHLSSTDPKEPLWMARRVEFVPVLSVR
ncbi:BON domain-containing protein [Tumidithrix elongata RA019]|uniref:BON domain-containing protein n=1 Tax=Tumidithrix elongata BACA0141 TaxID=2716417 RepID=A0AAW9PUF7_9CYAN|nr:BON domain-containing protein [Tumidithrix elongata RA019]